MFSAHNSRVCDFTCPTLPPGVDNNFFLGSFHDDGSNPYGHAVPIFLAGYGSQYGHSRPVASVSECASLAASRGHAIFALQSGGLVRRDYRVG